MASTELLFTPATRMAALIRRKQLSPVDYVDAVLAAIERLQPALNCFVTVMAEEARAAAIEAEQAVIAGRPLGPLHGVPVSIKDLIPTRGVRTTFGSVAFADNVPDRDDVLVTRLKAAGAIVIGKSTTPEFGIKGQTSAPLFGITRNPWDLERTPGGSSGGAAAAVAAGLGPLGLGSDGAGSTRIPAACCGLVGLKGTTGAVPYQETRDAFGNVIAAGPLTRTIADAVLMQSMMAGADPLDPWTAHAPPLGHISPRLLSQDLAGLRIGYLGRCAGKAVAADVAANTRASLDVLAGLGAEVEEVTAEIDWMAEDQRVLYLCSIANNLASVVERFGERTDPVLRAYVAAGKRYDIAAYIRAINARTRLFRAVQALFESYDVLVSPTLTRTALAADFDGAAGIVEIDGEAVGPVQPNWTGFVYPFNLTGHPALSVPSGWGRDGLPTGVQIVGPRHGDGNVLRLGALLEQARPWADRRPPVAVS
ncbi:amidase [Chelatococcus reniformis]|uniref:Glutamyl-tRNA amidotransferase subunit A n=1 Tax=Chelatococcus reniformis TaxID=1494448 RepID=A0A916XNL7_9HYPH|nr:amidase family protein [Chelatococcus reniformis]GGC89796.1 glutamyl-tRNA amidotransferase subunit A [Chelatococcus reniformis]